jgi:hypothetical protein
MVTGSNGERGIFMRLPVVKVIGRALSYQSSRTCREHSHIESRATGATVRFAARRIAVEVYLVFDKRPAGGNEGDGWTHVSLYWRA